jgi:formylglycine-generating enzyme required for sulfatase activity
MYLRFVLMRLTPMFLICLNITGTLVAQVSKEITNSIGITLVLIPKGTFQMGSPPGEKDSQVDERQHEVTISEDYYLGAFELTQAQYLKVMGNNPSIFQGDKVAERDPQTNQVVKNVDSSNHPVEQVYWHDAIEFCRRLSALPEEKAAGRVYRLPTEAEWEYACRAGSQTKYSFGDNESQLGDCAWYNQNACRQTHPVGEKKPNAWGLYDMHGNVWEWCSDWYGDYPEGDLRDPAGAREGTRRVGRGGGWSLGAEYCRSANRADLLPSYRNRSLGQGIRVALNFPTGIPK